MVNSFLIILFCSFDRSSELVSIHQFVPSSYLLLQLIILLIYLWIIVFVSVWNLFASFNCHHQFSVCFQIEWWSEHQQQWTKKSEKWLMTLSQSKWTKLMEREKKTPDSNVFNQTDWIAERAESTVDIVLLTPLIRINFRFEHETNTGTMWKF